MPSLTIADEAVELFADRARLVRADFKITDANLARVTEICRRLDGMPLAIELAAARVRALSLQEIVDSLHDRFRLLTGGSRTTVRRQQTLRASVDWSHALLTEPERLLFRRLAAFFGGFDLEAAQAVTGGGDVERYQVLDLLTLLVDKSLVVAEEVGDRSRYRLLETVRQYAQEKLAESGQADDVRTLHRDHYLALAVTVDARPTSGTKHALSGPTLEIDNMRAAFTWSRECGDTDCALQLACSLYPLWLARGRNREGFAWLETALDDRNTSGQEVAPSILAQALADKTMLDAWLGLAPKIDQAEQALAIARDRGDRGLLARALIARSLAVGYDAELAQEYFAEGLEVAREIDDNWRLTQLLGWRAYAAIVAGDPVAACDAAEEGSLIADAIGNHFASRMCRTWLGWADMYNGDLARAATGFDEVLVEAEAHNDLAWWFSSLHAQVFLRSFQGDVSGALEASKAALDLAEELGGFFPGVTYGALGYATLAGCDIDACARACDTASSELSVQPHARGMFVFPLAEVALSRGDLIAARRFANEAVSITSGWNLATAHRTRARVALAQREVEQAETDAHAALAGAADLKAYLRCGGHHGGPRAAGRGGGEISRGGEAARCGCNDAWTNGRGPIQDLRRRLRECGDGTSRCDGG